MNVQIKDSVVVYRIILGVALVLMCGVSADAQCDIQQTAKLLADDGSAEDLFGRAVAISGTTAIVGAEFDDDNGDRSGAAYLFNTTTGQQIAKLTPNDGAANDQFGRSVAIGGDIAIVGAYRDDDNGDDSGSAYLFDTTTGQQIAKLLPLDGTAGERFSFRAVAISGNTVIVGVERDDDNGIASGSAYLFDTKTGQQIAKLLADDGEADDQFGSSVSISGTTAIIGARRDDDAHGENCGSAYLFDTTTGTQLGKLLADDGAADDYFGEYVIISGTIAIVGAAGNDDNGDGSGSAYLFDTTTGQQIAKLLPDDGAAGDSFGQSISISGTTAIVGAAFNDDNGDDSGSAYLFDTTTGGQLAKLLPDDGAAGDQFGSWTGGVAISGTTVLVGAFRDDDNGDDSGSAYLFDVSCSDVVVGDSFLVTRGTHVSGGVAELAESDNLDLSIQRSNTDIQSRTEFEVQAVSPTASPTSLEVTLEGSVFGRSHVNQTIELFDYVAGPAGQWEQVDTRAATRFTDSTVTVAATGDLTRFVEFGTMCMKARIRYQSPVARQRFASNTDQFIWTIGQ